MVNINKILKEALEKTSLNKKDEESFSKETNNIIRFLKNQLKKKKIKAEIFVGGSFAKDTMIKKDKYDIDIFIRFEEKEEKKLIQKFEKLMSSIKNKTRIKGSRDYYQIVPQRKDVYFEIVPVMKIKKPGMENNITDLSYFHVSYIKNKIKKKKNISDEIRLAKSFCHSAGCYGAESYIRGFSGYALELLIVYYGSFIKFIKTMADIGISKEEKIIIDIEKQFKGKKDILNNINESKKEGPIIFVDPTFKERNALAALSFETFLKFKERCKQFIRNPKIKFFEKKKFDEQEFYREAKKKNAEIIKIKIKTSKQEGDIAGTKLYKFYKLLDREIEKNFELSRKDFVYDDKKSAECYFAVKKKKEIIIRGPKINDTPNVKKFKKKHRNCFIKKYIVYAKEKPLNIEEFYKRIIKNNKKRVKEMGIIKISLF